MAVRDLTARNAIEGRLWVRIYIFNFNYFLFTFFSIEFFEGVSRGGPYRWSMDQSVRWSMDPVRWTGPRTGAQCFRDTPTTEGFWFASPQPLGISVPRGTLMTSPQEFPRCVNMVFVVTFTIITSIFNICFVIVLYYLHVCYQV